MRLLAPRIFFAEAALARPAAATALAFRNVRRAGVSKLSRIDVTSPHQLFRCGYSRLALIIKLSRALFEGGQKAPCQLFVDHADRCAQRGQLIQVSLPRSTFGLA